MLAVTRITNANHTTVQAWLAEHQAQMAVDLESLCNLNSGSYAPTGLKRVADWLVDYFEPLGVPVERIELPGWSTLDDAGVQSAHTTGPALRWDFRCSNPISNRRILWTIHYDTV
jgi:acetylornithine deacetylase/succinyl-diaminopimelate desuccinylase-like protein